MSFERHPEATAALVSLDFAPLPTTVYANAEAELAQWTVTNLAKTISSMPGQFAAQFYNSVGGQAAGGYARRTISGLVPGRTYTFSMKYYGQSGVTNARGVWRLGVVGVGNGNSIDLKGTTTDRETAFTFVATATTHTLQLTLVAHSAGETTSLFRNAGVALRGEKLPVSEGEMSLDKGRVPFGEAQVTVPLMSVGLLEKLNPFAYPRVQLTATAENDPRTFDLVMTRRVVDHAARVVKLDLATDEAILQAYSKLTDDQGAFSRQDSLRSIINYVLGQAIPGAALQTTGAADRPFRVLTDATNMLLDPRYARTPNGGYGAANATTLVDTTWVSSENLWGVHLYNPTSTDGFFELRNADMAYGMQAGRSYTFSATGSVRSAMGGTEAAGRARRLVVVALVPGGYIDLATSPQVSTTVNADTRVSVGFTVPSNATQVWVRAYHGHTQGTITWRAFRLTETDRYAGTHNSEYFDGVRSNTTDYAYSWDGNADASTSKRIALFSRAPEVLSWRAGRSAWDFLAGIIDVAGLRLWCDEQRRWWLVDPKEYKVPGRISVRVDNATEGDDTMDAGGGDAPTGVVARFTWRDTDGTSKTKDDFAGTAGRVLVVEFDDRPFPGPGTAALLLTGMTNRGRTQDVTVASIMDATPGEEISISLPGTNDQLGQLQSVSWDLSEGLMDLRSSGLTEVTPGSWLQGYSERTWPNAPDTDTWASLT